MRRSFDISPGMERELEILRRATGLPYAELFQIGISLISLHAEIMSEGRTMEICGGNQPRERLAIKAFSLREAYQSRLPRLTDKNSSTRWQRLLKILGLASN